MSRKESSAPKKNTKKTAKERSGFARFLRGLGKLFLVLLILLVLLVTALYVTPFFEKTDATQVAGSADWMADVPDERLLSAMVIPGSHDTATQYAQLSFITRCQALSVGDQLAAGTRYLDVRLGADNGRLKLMHGFTNCKEGPYPWSPVLYLDAVLKQCTDFLDAHPTECILFAVKHEHGDEDAQEIARLLDAAFAPYSAYLLDTEQIPALGSARGKIVLFRRYGTAALAPNNGFTAEHPGIPLIWDDQAGTAFITPTYAEKMNGGYALRVQDRYKYDVETKWAAFSEGLGGGDLCLDFLSTTGKLAYGHPYYFAKKLNRRLESADLTKAAGGAVIIVDFISAKTASKIYTENFR